MKDRLTRDDCIALLVKKQDELNKIGENRVPKRSDFSDREIMAVKSFFGPFPRALEAAGIKEKRPDAEQKRREKRLRAKKNRLKYKLEKVKNCESRNIKEK